jgi:arylsulfatase A-like enzyme
LGYASWDYTPTGRGFSSYRGYLQGQCDYYTKKIADGFDFWTSREGSPGLPDWEAVGKYSMPLYMEEAERILDEYVVRREEVAEARITSIETVADAAPVFLYFAHQEIHIPLQPPVNATFDEACSTVTAHQSQNRSLLCRMTSTLDAAVGDFVGMMTARQMWDDTVMWTTSDNGGMTQWKVEWPASASSNWPLRGGKTTLFEGGVRVIGFISGGANFIPAAARGTTRSALMHAVDILPTLAGLANDTIAQGIDGQNQWLYITTGSYGATGEERTELPLNILPHCDACVDGVRPSYSAIIQGDMKLIDGYVGFSDGWWHNGGADGNYTRENATDTTDMIHLFNLTADPNERMNLATELPDVVKQLKARIQFYGAARNGFVNTQLNEPHPDALPELHNGSWAPYEKN